VLPSDVGGPQVQSSDPTPRTKAGVAGHRRQNPLQAISGHGARMTERASKLLKEDMIGMGPVRARDCEEAQASLVRLAKTLADRGEILLVDPKSDDAMII